MRWYVAFVTLHREALQFYCAAAQLQSTYVVETPQKHAYVPELFKSVMCNSRENYDLIHKEESKWSTLFFPQPALKSLQMSIKLVRYTALVTCATTVVSVRLYCQLIRFQYEVFCAINLCKLLFSTPELSSISCFQPQGLDYVVTCLPGKTNRKYSNERTALFDI